MDSIDQILCDYGWSPFFAQAFANQTNETGDAPRPCRVVQEHRGAYRVLGAAGEQPATLAGRLRHHLEAADLPAVGDWVTVDGAVTGPVAIQAVLPRRSRISRHQAGAPTREQVVAANVDTLFLVVGLDGDFNLRRLERLLAMAWQSGAEPVVLLTKSDLEPTRVDARSAQAQAVAPGVRVLVLSSYQGQGIDELQAILQPAATYALVGSSGVGKSTLANRLSGAELLATGAVRSADDRGRHTTTHRQLVRLPSGALLIDNPGIRELQLWSDEGLGGTFQDIESLAAGCRFGDCGHQTEPGCAVLTAVTTGELDSKRLENYRGLQRETRFLELRQDAVARRGDRKRVAAIHKEAKRLKKRW